MDSDEKDLFQEAAENALNLTNNDNEEEEEANVEIIDEYDEIYDSAVEIINEEKEWKKLVKDMNGVHAKKFNAILKTLPDRDFVRAYLSSLEYFKPKIIRQDIKPAETVDQTININIVQVNKEGEINIIKIGNKDE